MIWLGDITTDIGQNLLLQVGAPLTALIVGEALIIVYLVRKGDAREKEIKLSIESYQEKLDIEKEKRIALQDKRLEDSKEDSRIAAIPLQELTTFVGKLYDNFRINGAGK